MSAELPEAKILAKQMNKELVGKKVELCHLADCESMQRLNLINKNITDFKQLVGGKIDAVVSRGCTILVKLDNNMNLTIESGQGGELLYHSSEATLPERVHLRIDFSDSTHLTVRFRGLGMIKAVATEDLKRDYLYWRDLSQGISPLDEQEFTPERFSELLQGQNRMLKSVLVGKGAILVGLGNSAFQEIAYKAKVHPKRKASSLNSEEQRALQAAVKEIISNRLQQGGKEGFFDLYGNEGRYKPVMGSRMKGRPCPECGTIIQRLSVAGGIVYYCPSCQR